MQHLPYGHSHNTALLTLLWRLLWQHSARLLSPTWKRAVVLSRAPLVRTTAARVLLLVGLVMQVVLLLVLGYMVDLCISLMELWAELARKHLELTL